MISVFRGNNYIEAQLLAGMLRQHGIDVFLQGAALQGALGDLPMVGYLSIMVAAEDRSAAERWLKAYERGELTLTDADWDIEQTDPG